MAVPFPTPVTTVGSEAGGRRTEAQGLSTAVTALGDRRGWKPQHTVNFFGRRKQSWEQAVSSKLELAGRS